MKLKKYNQLFESPRHWDDEDDDELFGRPNYSSKDDYDYDDYSAGDYDEDDEYSYENEDSDDDDTMQTLLNLLRQMFTQSGIEVYTECSGLDISICVPLSQKEDLKSFVKIFDIAKKLKKDILAQYDSSYELWYTKEGYPVIEFTFNFQDEGYSSSSKDSPF